MLRGDQWADVVDDEDLCLTPAPVADVVRAGIVGVIRVRRLRGELEQRCQAHVAYGRLLEGEFGADAGGDRGTSRADRPADDHLAGSRGRWRFCLDQLLELLRHL